MTLRVGIVGLEPGTHWSAYLAALQELPAVALAGVALRPALEETMRDRLTAWDVPVYHRATDLLDRESLQVLALSTVPDQQAELVLEGLRRGLHVVADKPLVTTREALDQVRRALSARPGLRLSMLMTLRGDPARQAARQLVQDGAIGRIATLHSRRAYEQRREARPAWFFDEDRSGGPWLDGAIHGIDEVLWIAGSPIHEVAGYDANVSWPEQARFYDSGQALLRLDSGVTAVVEHSRLALSDCWLSVVGTRGKIEIDRRNRGVLIDADGERPLDTVMALPPARNVFTDFLASIMATQPAQVDTADTLITMEAALRVREAIRAVATVSTA
jgi:predicted dehydrogenase